MPLQPVISRKNEILGSRFIPLLLTLLICKFYWVFKFLESAFEQSRTYPLQNPKVWAICEEPILH